GVIAIPMRLSYLRARRLSTFDGGGFGPEPHIRTARTETMAASQDCASEAKRMTESDRERRIAALVGIAVESRVVPEHHQQFGSGQEFPAITGRELHVLADIVVFHLGQKLHIGREVEGKIERPDM